jgi:hypothetical protein
MEMFLTYVAKVEEYYGVTKTRDVFEKAIEVLPDKEVRMQLLCLIEVPVRRRAWAQRLVLPCCLPSLVVQAKEMCLKFAAVERRLGEIDRARAVLTHGSQLCDPRIETGYWEVGAKWCVGMVSCEVGRLKGLLAPPPLPVCPGECPAAMARLRGGAWQRGHIQGNAAREALRGEPVCTAQHCHRGAASQGCGAEGAAA